MADRTPLVIRQLVALRKRAGLSQAELARVLGTQQSAISEIESQLVSPTLATLAKYAGQFGMEITITPEVLRG